MSTKIDIISGFLGSGKTTLIKKLIDERLKDEKIVIIENEFGEVAIDGSILKERNIDVKEIKSGCICCSLLGNFKEAIKEIINIYNPQRIIVEPSGVAKLSDIIRSFESIKKEYDITINMVDTVIDVINYEIYIDNFGEFYKDQIISAKTIILSRTHEADNDLIRQVVDSITLLNRNADIITTPWNLISSDNILKISEKNFNIYIENDLSNKVHHVHSADKIFDTWGIETSKIFSELDLKSIFENITTNSEYGFIIRAKGIVEVEDKKWVQFHYIPKNFEISQLNNQEIGKICIIGERLNKHKLKDLFEVSI